MKQHIGPSRTSSGISFVFSSVGYGVGVALYIIFGIFAGFSGWAFWKIFVELESSRYPLVSFGDAFFRSFGKRSRHFINVAQALQQVLDCLCADHQQDSEY